MYDSKWEYEYKALKAQITDPKMVENGKRLVEAAIEVSRVSAISFSECFHSIVEAAIKFQNAQRAIE
jgi:hypothetical protein